MRKTPLQPSQAQGLSPCGRRAWAVAEVEAPWALHQFRAPGFRHRPLIDLFDAVAPIDAWEAISDLGDDARKLINAQRERERPKDAYKRILNVDRAGLYNQQWTGL